VARNRKRAKERQARRREPVVTGPGDRDEPPSPTGHAAPDVELAEAQLALGRPELIGGEDGAAQPDLSEEAFEAEEDEADFAGGDGGDGGRPPESPGLGGDGGRRPEGPEQLPERGGDTAAAHPARKPSLITRLIHFMQGSWRELQRVQWPDRRQVVQATGVVIGFVIVAGIYLGLADEVASKLVTFVLK
jgi:preprotein translocase subunit SecE